MRRAAVINVSTPHYNLGACKLANWLISEGWQVEYCDGGCERHGRVRHAAGETAARRQTDGCAGSGGGKEEMGQGMSDCRWCGPVCYGGAAHNARVEDGVPFGGLPGEKFGMLVPVDEAKLGKCIAVSQYGCRCALDLGHAGDHDGECGWNHAWGNS